MTTKTTASFLYGSVISAGLALLPFSTAWADGTLDVSATVVATCDVSDISHLTFGDYDPTVITDTSAIAGFSVTCSTHASVGISLGTGGFPEGTQRRMSDGAGNFLEYDLYQESSGATPFGVGDVLQADVSASTATPVPVYGFIPASQLVQAGDYNDSVLISLDF